MKIVPKLNFYNYERVMNTVPIIIVAILKNKEDKRSDQIINVMESLKHELQGKVQMSYVYENQKGILKELKKDVNRDLTMYSMLLQTFNIDGKRQYYFLQEQIDSKMILNNLEKLKNEELEEIHISENIPKEQDPKRVQKVVYNNWKKAVIDYEKDTVVLFTVKWCKACKQFRPIYRKLAKDVLAVNDNIQFVKYNP